MKKLIILFTLLIVGVLACSSCTKKTQVPDVQEPSSTCDGGSCELRLPEASVPEVSVEASVAVNDVVSQDNWSFVVPGQGWTSAKPPSEFIKISMTNTLNGCMLFLFAETTEETFAEYVIMGMRMLHESGGTIVSAKQVVVYGNKFVLVEANKNDSVIYAWLTKKDDKGYVFTCGGVITADSKKSMQELCYTVGNSLQIK